VASSAQLYLTQLTLEYSALGFSDSMCEAFSRASANPIGEVTAHSDGLSKVAPANLSAFVLLVMMPASFACGVQASALEVVTRQVWYRANERYEAPRIVR